MKTIKTTGKNFIGLLNSDDGAALVIIILSIIVVGTLTGAIVTLTSTSQIEAVHFNMGMNAYHVAESGYRFIAAEYRNTENENGDANADDEKTDFLYNHADSKTFNLPNNMGTFSVAVNPYWFISSSDQTSNVIKVEFPGQVPEDFALPTQGTIKIGDETGHYFNYTNASLIESGKGNSYQITLSSSITLDKNESIYLTLNANPAQSSVSQDGNLQLLASTSFDNLKMTHLGSKR